MTKWLPAKGGLPPLAESDYDCTGEQNIMCAECLGVIEHNCQCSKSKIRFCGCAKPKPLKLLNEPEGANDGNTRRLYN